MRAIPSGISAEQLQQVSKVYLIHLKSINYVKNFRIRFNCR